MTRELAAPSTLGIDTRTDFRKAAVDLLEGMPEGAGRLVVDLSGTVRVDSAGLGVLMLVQRRAAERGLTVVLRNVTAVGAARGRYIRVTGPSAVGPTPSTDAR